MLVNEMNDSMVEPTDELFSLYEAGHPEVFDECEEVKGTDGKVRPYVYNLWSKDLDHDYSVAPTHPWSQLFDGDDLTPMYDLSSAEGKFLRISLAREFFIEYEDVLTDLATKYFEHYVEEKSIKELAEMLNTPYHTIVYQYHNQKWTDIKIINMLAHNMQALLMLPPELIVSEEVAGDELLEIQRYLYKYLRETFN